jgi:hypothetical protein
MLTKSTSYPAGFFGCSSYEMTTMISVGASQTFVIVQSALFSRDVADDDNVPSSSQIERHRRMQIAICSPYQNDSFREIVYMSLTCHPAPVRYPMMNSSVWREGKCVRSVDFQIPLYHILCRVIFFLLSSKVGDREEVVMNRI